MEYSDVAKQDLAAKADAHKLFEQFIREGEGIAETNPNAYFWLRENSRAMMIYYMGEVKYQTHKAGRIEPPAPPTPVVTTLEGEKDA